ncbi:uncharacterized protein LOC143293122 [Babylonia areolata]|uniref:uncharacterized protein LOC143293122 n=1 Tax=Babylonia areolata TaxID=304850 RepID=UPI003FD277DB
MDPSQLLATLTALLFCTCAAAIAHPAAPPQERQLQGLLSQLFTNAVSKDTRPRDAVLSADHWPIDNNDDDEADEDAQSSRDAPSVSVNGKSLSALKRGYQGFSKRHYYYDYGLGGGRFGKRYYGDYGIGGGRFGRDVDHVDIADTNDAAH